MRHACTDVGESLRRGALAKELPPSDPQPPPLPRKRVTADIPVEIYAAPRRSSHSGAPPTAPSADAAPAPPPLREARRSDAGAEPSQPPDEPRSIIEELAHEVHRKHGRFLDDVDKRASNLALVQTFWAHGNLTGCLHALCRCGDVYLATDWLRIFNAGSNPTHFTATMCSSAVPLVSGCLRAPVETIVTSTLSFLVMLLEGFGPKIRDVARQDERGGKDPRDLGAAKRRQRLMEARDAFASTSLERALQETLKRSFAASVHARAQYALDSIGELSAGLK